MKYKFVFYISVVLTVYIMFNLLKDDVTVTYSWITQQHIAEAKKVAESAFPKLEDYFLNKRERLPKSLDEVGLGHFKNIPGNVYISGLHIQHHALFINLHDAESGKRIFFALLPQPTMVGVKWTCNIGKIDRGLFEAAYPECLPPESTPYTRLLEMVDYGVPTEVKKAIAQGADVNKIYNGRFPLYYAIKNKSKGMVKLLINSGADVNLVNHQDYDKTPLMYAIEKDNMDIVKILVENGANTNAKDSDGDSVLDYVEKGDDELGDYLVENGAQVSTRY